MIPEPQAQGESVYIAGPMRGYPLFNFPAFDAAELEWLQRGWRVVSPAQMDRTLDGFTGAPEEVKPFSHYMRRDIEALLGVEAVAFLPGWEKSRGACIEHTVARALDLRLYKADGSPLHPEVPHACV